MRIKLSQNAAYHKREFVAEAFAQLKTTGTTSKYSKQMHVILKTFKQLQNIRDSRKVQSKIERLEKQIDNSS